MTGSVTLIRCWREAIFEYLTVIVISKFQECSSKAKRTSAPAYSRVLRRIKEVVQRLHSKIRSDFQRVKTKQLPCQRQFIRTENALRYCQHSIVPYMRIISHKLT